MRIINKIEEKVLLQNNVAGEQRIENESFKQGKMVERNREVSRIRVLSMGFRLSTLTVKILHNIPNTQHPT